MNLSFNRKTAIKATLLIAMAVMYVFAYSAGPPAGYTGAFGEPNCTECHSDFGVNEGDGTFQILNVPDQYTPGQTYPITVSLAQNGQRRWGFQLAARFATDGSQAGVIQLVNPDLTQILVEDGIMYIEHTAEGTYLDTVDGPVTWQFNWTAPDADAAVDDVLFAAAGNAANGDFKPTGDYIYLAQVTSAAPSQ